MKKLDSHLRNCRVDYFGQGRALDLLRCRLEPTTSKDSPFLGLNVYKFMIFHPISNNLKQSQTTSNHLKQPQTTLNNLKKLPFNPLRF